MALVIGEKETRKLINMPQALKVVENIFRDRAAAKVRALPRQRLKGSSKQLNMMAAWQSEWDLLCLRAYAGAANTITLYNGKSGEIRLVLNAAYLSSLRTGAASGVAAKYLAPRNSQVMGIIGPGWQATFQVEAIAQACQVRQVLVFGRDPKKTRRFIKQMGKTLSVELTESPSVEEMKERSDIIVLATDSSLPLIEGSNLKDETLIITMGANQPVKHEVSLDLIRKMDLVVTDDISTAQHDSGDLIAACESGILRWEDVVPLERIVSRGGPENHPKRILFQSNGIADEDLAVGRYILDRVRRKNLKVRRISEI
jgi:ornithine cyclodeaminase